MPEIKAIPWKKEPLCICVCVSGEVGTQKKEGWLHSMEHRVHRHHINLLYTFLSMLISSKIQLPRFALKGEKVTCHSLWQFHSIYALSCISEWGYLRRQEEWVTNNPFAVLTLSLKWPGTCLPGWTVCCVMGLRNESVWWHSLHALGAAVSVCTWLYALSHEGRQKENLDLFPLSAALEMRSIPLHLLLF